MLPPRLILGVLSLGGALGGARLLRARRETRAREVERVRQALLTDPEPDPFALAWVAGLPEPARRYLAHALAPGIQLPTSAHLRMVGNIRSEPGGEWLEVEADEVLAPPRGLVWSARIRGRVLSLSGDELYLAGRGESSFWLMDRLPVLRAAGPDVSRSAAGRVAAESVLLPSALLPGHDLEWRPGDDMDSARAVFKVDTTPAELTLRLAGDGALRSATLQRWGPTRFGPGKPGRYGWQRFRVDAYAERTFAGITIPVRMSATWVPDEGPEFEFFRAEITRATFG
ncbi:MAG: DUF6544 family protein [Nannocystaceae bacterium]